jgi:hypothetical protein
MKNCSKSISIGALALSLILSPLTGRKAHALDSAPANTSITYDNTSVNGTIMCTSSVSSSATSLAAGTIVVVADGKGNLTSGNASYSGGPAVSGISCNYALSSGMYSVQADGTGRAVTNWTLIAQNSSPKCALTVSQRGISFSLKQASFSAPTSASRTESGNCSVAANAASGAQ